MNQVVFGFACGSIRPFRAKASSLIMPRPSLWITWPVTPVVPGGPSLRRWPTPNRRTSIGMSHLPARAAGASAGDGSGSPRDRWPSPARRRRLLVPFGRIVDSGWANFDRVK